MFQEARITNKTKHLTPQTAKTRNTADERNHPKSISRRVRSHRTQPLDVPSSARNDAHRRPRVIQARRIGDAAAQREEPLRVMHVSENCQIDAVLVQQRFEGDLARLAHVSAASCGVPGPMATDDDPRRHGTIYGGEMRLSKLWLLVGRAKRAAVHTRGARWAVWRLLEIRLGVEHNNVRHPVLEAVPEWGIGKQLRFVDAYPCGGVQRGGGEWEWRGVADTVHEIREVLLAGWAQAGEVRNLLTIGFKIAWGCHGRLAACYRGELVIELLEDGFVGVGAVE